MNARLREARLTKGLSLQEAGDLVGLDPNTIARYEAGRYKPSSTSLVAFAYVYDKPADFFLIGSRELGKKLRHARRAAGLSQLAAAEAVGIHQVTVSKFERGIQDPSTEYLLAMARVYAVSMDWLLDLEWSTVSENHRDSVSLASAR